MIEPRREEFGGGVPVAMYRLVAPATVKLRAIAGPCRCVAGATVSIGGYPPAAASPLNHEALYAKVCAIRRDVAQKGWIKDAVLIAKSVGGSPSSEIDACDVILAWLKNPRPVVQS
jgi:hypothetical protein